MELINYLNTKVKFSEEECTAIDAAFKREFYPKGSLLELPENRSQTIHFIEKGLIRSFYNKDGKDITHFFFDENTLAMSLEGVYFNKQDPYGREILEDATLRTIRFSEFEILCTRFRTFKDFVFIVAIEVIKQFSDRLFSIQFQTAEQRYKFLIDNYPNILLRAPLGHIASYLGITQQTLSVIRGRS